VRFLALVRLSDICQERIPCVFGHIMCLSRHGLDKLIVLGSVEGKRARGRIPVRWTDAIMRAAKCSLSHVVL
jgi:hypothetical protein